MRWRALLAAAALCRAAAPPPASEGEQRTWVPECGAHLVPAEQAAVSFALLEEQPTKFILYRSGGRFPSFILTSLCNDYVL